MIFTEAAFLGFLAIVLPLYFLTRSRWALTKGILLTASYVFYGWADWRFTILLFVSSTVDYLIAPRVAGARTSRARLAWLSGGVTFGLLLLGFFKYFGLMAITVNALATSLRADPLLPVLEIALPAGISFYTFQSMSYLIDVYRGKLEPSRSFFTYLLFVSYFPQLVAGPIERATHLLPQFDAPPRIRPDMVADGCRQILAGYLMKTVVADNLGPFVDRVYGDASGYNAPLLLAATAFFGLQIYCDFAGYSNIAIGLGKVMGFEIMRNFSTPYFATSLQDFWRRWHISLSTFFRDYLYVPLGGSRGGLARTIVNVIIVFAVSGLWHGANWTFVAWGLYHGVGLSVAIAMAHIPYGEGRRGFSLALGLTIAGLVTQCYVLLGWIFFRAQSLADMMLIWSRILDPALYNPYQSHILAEQIPVMIVAMVFLALEFIQRKRSHLLDVDWLSSRWRFPVYCSALLSILLLGSGTKTEFIYFRF